MSTFLRTVGISRIVFLIGLLFPAAVVSHAQQDYVGRYNIYTGFSDLSSPGLNSLNQIGFHLQAGLNTNRLIGTGFDYSVQSGTLRFLPTSRLRNCRHNWQRWPPNLHKWACCLPATP
jgi:hypothetical protein